MKSISDNKLQINDQYKDINRYKLNKYWKIWYFNVYSNVVFLKMQW